MGQVTAMPQRTVKQPCMARLPSAIAVRIICILAVVSAAEMSHDLVSTYRPLLARDCLSILLGTKLQNNVVDVCLKAWP